ncbi:hypothetical protein ACUZ8Y_22945 [Aeromonas veronii]|uniref:hypothetical protein n=1 Tax=Aeromonas veronii TaxID=654 RepID=UPI00406BB3DB
MGQPQAPAPPEYREPDPPAQAVSLSDIEQIACPGSSHPGHRAGEQLVGQPQAPAPPEYREPDPPAQAVSLSDIEQIACPGSGHPGHRAHQQPGTPAAGTGPTGAPRAGSTSSAQPFGS